MNQKRRIIGLCCREKMEDSGRIHGWQGQRRSAPSRVQCDERPVTVASNESLFFVVVFTVTYPTLIIKLILAVDGSRRSFASSSL